MPTLRLWLPLCCHRRRLQTNGKVCASNGGSKDRSDALETALASKTEASCRICPFRYRFRCEQLRQPTTNTPNRLAAELVAESNQRSIRSQRSNRQQSTTAAIAVSTISTHAHALMFHVVFINPTSTKWTLENAWLFLLAGVFNMSFSTRASGSSARF